MTVIHISRVTVIVQVISCICAVVALCVHNEGLLWPWLIFSAVQLIQYAVYSIFALTIKEYTVAGLCFLYMILLGGFYVCVLRYYRELRRISIQKKQTVAEEEVWT